MTDKLVRISAEYINKNWISMWAKNIHKPTKQQETQHN